MMARWQPVADFLRMLLNLMDFHSTLGNGVAMIPLIPLNQLNGRHSESGKHIMKRF